MAQASLLDQAIQQFPRLGDEKLLYKLNPAPNRGFLEFWPAGEGGTPEQPRPKEFPQDAIGLEVYDPKTRPIDIAGDVVSHHLVKTDPEYKKYYSDFEKSLTQQQKAKLQEQYKYAQTNFGEKRSYEDWYKSSGLPGYFRGYAFQQWDNPQKLYTPEQIKMFDQMMANLKTAKKQQSNENMLQQMLDSLPEFLKSLGL